MRTNVFFSIQNQIKNSLMKYATNVHMNKSHKSLRKRDNE